MQTPIPSRTQPTAPSSKHCSWFLSLSLPLWHTHTHTNWFFTTGVEMESAWIIIFTWIKLLFANENFVILVRECRKCCEKINDNVDVQEEKKGARWINQAWIVVFLLLLLNEKENLLRYTLEVWLAPRCYCWHGICNTQTLTCSIKKQGKNNKKRSE